jgi:energy-coupling factor transport system ATP-binding protein
VLSDISFDLYPGEIAAVMGDNGGGKGLIFQNPNHHIFETSVMKEALLACSILRKDDYSVAELEKLLCEFGLLPYKEKIPQTLSMGEKKRLTMVSVLACKPDILLLDEPLAGQDLENVKLLFKKLRGYCGTKKSAIISCHNPEKAFKYCDRILFLDKGKLMFDAPPDRAKALLLKLGRSEYLPP